MKILDLIWILSISLALWSALNSLVWAEVYRCEVWNNQIKDFQLFKKDKSEGIVMAANDQKKNSYNNSSIAGPPFTCTISQGPPLPREWARGGHAGGIVNGSVVVAGGTEWSKDKTTKYWLKNSAVFLDERWVKGPDLPKPLAYSMYAHDSSGLYIAGGTVDGNSMSADVYVLNSLKEGEGWKSLPQLPEEISSGAGAILNGKFYVTCGSFGTENTNRMWVLDIHDPGSNWHECQPVPGVVRVFPSLVTCKKYLYLIGGLEKTSPLKPLQDIYRYHPDKDEWIRLKDLPIKGYAWVSQPIDNNNLIITGRADGSIHKGIWIIDLRDMSMKKVGNLESPSTTAPLVNISENQWWLIGGEPDTNKNRTEKVSVINLE